MRRPGLTIGLAGLASVALMVGTHAPEAGRLADGAGIAGPATFARATKPAARDSLRRSALPAAVWGARDSIAALFAGGKGITVERGSGHFEGLLHGRLITTCRLTIRGASETEPGAGEAEMIWGHLTYTGWKSDPGCDADGPDGTMFGMRRNGVFCHVNAEWDGGDDDDSTYVPGPEYIVVVDCLVDRAEICSR